MKLNRGKWKIKMQSTIIQHHLIFLCVSLFLDSVTLSLCLSLSHRHSRRKERLSNDVSTLRGGLDVRQRAITNAVTSITLC